MSLVTRHFIVMENNRPAETDIEVYGNDEIPEGTSITFLERRDTRRYLDNFFI